MAARKNNNQQYNRKDFKYYTKTFGNFLYGMGYLVFPLCPWNFRIYAFFEDLENPDSNLATEVISADQVVIVNSSEKTDRN
jgi:penicillin-binding protein 1A